MQQVRLQGQGACILAAWCIVGLLHAKMQSQGRHAATEGIIQSSLCTLLAGLLQVGITLLSSGQYRGLSACMHQRCHSSRLCHEYENSVLAVAAAGGDPVKLTDEFQKLQQQQAGRQS